MKKILFSAALAISVATSYAQPVLTGAQINPSPGDVFFGHQAGSMPDSAGPSGASVIWNFGSLTYVALDTSSFVSCASTPYCDSFPGSTIAIASSGGDYTYFTANASAWSTNGYYSGGTAVHYTDPAVFVKYPLTYHDHYVDTAVMAYPGGFAMTEIDSSYADAYGTLILPSGTFPGTLRVYTRSVSISTMPGYPPSYDTSVRYAWYSSGFHAPLLSVRLDHSSGSWGISFATYLTTINTAGVKDANIVASLKAYPNPATDVINISVTLPGAEHVTLTLSDVVGKPIEERPTEMKAGYNELSIPVANLTPGMYLMQLRTAREAMTIRLSVAH